MSTLRKFVVFVLAALIIAVLAPAAPAAAHCTAYHPHHCVDDIYDTVNPSAPSSSQVYEFTLINSSNETVYVAYGKYRPYSSRSGDLAVVTLAAWTAEGWWSVAPGTSRNIYRSNSDEHIYFRFESSSDAIVPSSYESSAEFCTSNYAFYSEEMEQQQPSNRYNFRIRANGQNTNAATCAEAGGQWETFYKMRVHMDFTVN